MKIFLYLCDEMGYRKLKFYCPNPEEHFTGTRKNGPREWKSLYNIPKKIYKDTVGDIRNVIPAWFTTPKAFGTLTKVGNRKAYFSSDHYGFIDIRYDDFEGQMKVHCEMNMRALYLTLKEAGYRCAKKDHAQNWFFIHPPVPEKAHKGTDDEELRSIPVYI